MSYVLPFLLFSTLLSLSTSSERYGTIHNASIQILFPVNTDHGYKLEREHCYQCLCHAFGDPNVMIFTCTKNEPINVICQFYDFMPRRDEIVYPKNGTNVYLIRSNKTYEEKDNCCNTTALIERIKEQISSKQTIIKGIPLRSVIEGYNNTIVAVISDQSKDKNVLLFDKSTFTPIAVPSTLPLKAIGYYDRKYYFGTQGGQIKVYNENMSLLPKSSTSVGSAINTIRFLSKTQEMLVGTASDGVYICEQNNIDGILDSCTPMQGTDTDKQVHAIGIVDENAFYVGWDDSRENIRLYTRDQSNTWKENIDGTINHNAQAFDLFVDDCKRVWVVVPKSDKIMIYHRNKNLLGEINIGGKYLFNLIIFENYTLLMSHESNDGLIRIQPTLNCRQPR